MTGVMGWSLVVISKMQSGLGIYKMYCSNYCNLSKITPNISGG